MRSVRFIMGYRVGAMLAVLCLMGSGCQAIMDGIGNKIDYDSGVDYYREHGMNRKDAERNAYEDQIWDNMR